MVNMPQPNRPTRSTNASAPHSSINQRTASHTSIMDPTLTSSSGTLSNPAQSSLSSRVNEKKEELARLRELCQLSAGLAEQMKSLESKLNTLADGTQAVATVMSNWHNVLNTIRLASTKLSAPDDASAGSGNPSSSTELPETLVRVPVEQSAALEQMFPVQHS